MDVAQPQLSVILPAYNAQSFIKEAIASVLNQTYSNFELIVINDGSIDCTEEIILSFKDPRIKYIKNETNLKLIKTLNKGVDLAIGEYIARMDADDICLPTRFEKEINYLINNPEVDIVSCFPYNMNMDGRILCKSSYFSCTRPNACKFVAIFEPPIMHPGSMFRAHILKENKYSDKPENYHIEAYELWNRLMYNKNVQGGMIPEYLLLYRDNITSITHTYVNEQWERHISLLKKSLLEYLKIETNDSILVCLATKNAVDNLKSIESAFNLLDEAYKKYIDLFIVDKLDIKEIDNWCNQKKISILLTTLVSCNKYNDKLIVLGKIIKYIKLLFKAHNMVYIQNRIIRKFNEMIKYR